MSVASPAPAVEIEDVRVTFETDRGAITAIEQVSCTLAPGSFLSIVGPSGCGKSTLLRVIADLVEPSGGRVRVLGESPERARSSRSLGFVFQDAALLPWRTAEENVRLPLELHGATVQPGAPTPAELLELVGLGGRERAYPRELSGGMRQRVSIARALVTQPRVLLMDEPFGALDEITRDRLNEELLRIWEATRTSIVFVTHSISEAVFLSEQVLLMTKAPGAPPQLVPVDLPYPRHQEIKDTMEFTALVARLRALLRGVSWA